MEDTSPVVIAAPDPIVPLNVTLQHAASALIDARTTLGQLLADTPPDMGTLPTGALSLAAIIESLTEDIQHGVSTMRAPIGEL